MTINYTCGDLMTSTDTISPDVLGYDPRIDQHDWRGTPIPRVNNPLPATPELVEIADKMWWNGDPWTILRNRVVFLRHALDYALEEDCEFLWRTIPREDWVHMLTTARPGQVSMRSWKYWSWRAGLLDGRLRIPAEWYQSLHIKDQLYNNQETLADRKQALHSSEGG